MEKQDTPAMMAPLLGICPGCGEPFSRFTRAIKDARDRHWHVNCAADMLTAPTLARSFENESETKGIGMTSRDQPWPHVILRLSPLTIAAALGVKKKDVEEIFSDGRVIAPIATYWAARTYGGMVCGAHRNAYVKTFAFPGFTVKAAVRVMTDRVSFHPSKNKGVGRSYDPAGFLKSLQKIEQFFVVDVSRWQDRAEVRLTVCPSKRIIHALNYLEYDAQGWLAGVYYVKAFGEIVTALHWKEAGE